MPTQFLSSISGCEVPLNFFYNSVTDQGFKLVIPRNQKAELEEVYGDMILILIISNNMYFTIFSMF